MSDSPDPKRLEALDARLAKVKQAHAPIPPKESHITQAQAGWRMVTELVVGLLLGFGVGYGLDRLLGTEPWLMILFIGFGFAAGVRVMLRTAREIQNRDDRADDT